ncbi:hypothetical protein ACIBBG_33865 [Micromonospora chersina]|uniref:hypothetical protein n=1 Tax=Micromonospora chersina TaxID=47854 RepID=UPI0037A64E5C
MALRTRYGLAGGLITLGLVATLEALNTQIKVLDEEIKAAFHGHPNQKIFTSLPRAGVDRAASLLAGRRLPGPVRLR